MLKKREKSSFRNLKKIQIVSPGSGAKRESLVKAEAFLKKNINFKIIPTNLVKGCVTKPYLAAEDSLRLMELEKALSDKSVDIIWCARGGYGSIRLMSKLWKMKKPKKKKLLIGYSDVTTLHQLWSQKWNFISIHGPLFENLDLDRLSHDSLKQLISLLQGNDCKYDINPLNTLAKKNKIKAETKVVGGNLTTIMSSFGLHWQIRAENKLLLLEEVNERGYKLDRMFVQLLNSKVLNKSDGILLGDFIGGNETDGKNYTKNAINDFCAQCPVPVYEIQGLGHGPQNFSIALNQKALLNDRTLTVYGIKI